MQQPFRSGDPDAGDRRQVAVQGALIGVTGAALPLTRAAAANPSSPSETQLLLVGAAVFAGAAALARWGLVAALLVAVAGLFLTGVAMWVILTGRAHIGAAIAPVGGATMAVGGLRELATASLGRDPGPYV